MAGRLSILSRAYRAAREQSSQADKITTKLAEILPCPAVCFEQGGYPQLVKYSLTHKLGGYVIYRLMLRRK